MHPDQRSTSTTRYRTYPRPDGTLYTLDAAALTLPPDLLATLYRTHPWRTSLTADDHPLDLQLLRADGLAKNIAFATAAHGLPAKVVWDTIAPQDGPFFISPNLCTHTHGSNANTAGHNRQGVCNHTDLGLGDWVAGVAHWCHQQRNQNHKSGLWFIVPITAADVDTILLTLARTPSLKPLLRFTHDLILAKQPAMWSRPTPAGPIVPCPVSDHDPTESLRDIVCFWLVPQQVLTPCTPHLWHAQAPTSTSVSLLVLSPNLPALEPASVYILQFPKELASTTAQVCQLLNGTSSDSTTYMLDNRHRLLIQPGEISQLDFQPLPDLLYTTVQRTTRLTLTKVQARVSALQAETDTPLAMALQDLCDLGDTESLTSSMCQDHSGCASMATHPNRRAPHLRHFPALLSAGKTTGQEFPGDYR